jgi:parallel beta-helix repeat protein
LYRNGKWKAGESAVIMISGTLTASGPFPSNDAMIDISGFGNYPPIILEGDPVTGGVLNANRSNGNDGRVLYIANNKVTLGNNLTLTGGHKLWGGAVCVGNHGEDSAGEFIMAGGEISGNAGELGGAVMVYKGSMTMSGGVIKQNRTDYYPKYDGSGGGIYLNSETTLTFSGGTIEENGSAQNTDSGGGILVNGEAVFIMTGGTIRNNTAKDNGGGVCVLSAGEFTLSGGTISGNTAATGGGVYAALQYGAIFTNNGGTISGNTPN